MVFGCVESYFYSCYAMPLLVGFPARTIMLNSVPNCNCVEKSYQYLVEHIFMFIKPRDNLTYFAAFTIWYLEASDYFIHQIFNLSFKFSAHKCNIICLIPQEC